MNDTYYAFLGPVQVAAGALSAVLTASYPYRGTAPSLLIFDGAGRQTDFDWRGGLDEVLARALPPPRTGPGRPKLGVRSVEVTLLPRHWEWLDGQPARASGTLRRLVDAAMAAEASDPKKRAEALGRILWVVAGNEADFEESMRALYALDRQRLAELTARWPGDLPAFVREFLPAEG